MKIPDAKIQAPEMLQCSSTKALGFGLFEVWNLEFGGFLALGA